MMVLFFKEGQDGIPKIFFNWQTFPCTIMHNKNQLEFRRFPGNWLTFFKSPVKLLYQIWAKLHVKTIHFSSISFSKLKSKKRTNRKNLERQIFWTQLKITLFAEQVVSVALTGPVRNFIPDKRSRQLTSLSKIWEKQFETRWSYREIFSLLVRKSCSRRTNFQ